mmetsp:Transcript_98932/g.317224  ORF Transcript_98932/g.317224 Transcript_98932/m.317224 type:complete len:202 (-) Transcript_98932:1720-2325(-)
MGSRGDDGELRRRLLCAMRLGHVGSPPRWQFRSGRRNRLGRLFEDAVRLFWRGPRRHGLEAFGENVPRGCAAADGRRHGARRGAGGRRLGPAFWEHRDAGPDDSVLDWREEHVGVRAVAGEDFHPFSALRLDDRLGDHRERVHDRCRADLELGGSFNEFLEHIGGRLPLRVPRGAGLEVYRRGLHDLHAPGSGAGFAVLEE